MNRAEQLKAEIKKKVLKSVAIIGGLGAVAAGVAYYDSDMEDQLLNMNNQISIIQSEIIIKNNEFGESEIQLNEYLDIPVNNLPTKDGYDIGRKRLKVSQPVMKRMLDIYMFKQLNYSLTEVRPDDMLKTQSYSVFKNTVVMDFTGATDEFVFSFINDLKHTLPGYIYIKSLDITRSAEVTNETMGAYLTPEGSPLIQGKMELVWNTLKLPENTQEIDRSAIKHIDAKDEVAPAAPAVPDAPQQNLNGVN